MPDYVETLLILANGKIVAFEEFIDTAEMVSAFNPPQ